MGQLPGMEGMFAIMAIICGLIGWGVIEFALWFFSNLSWGA